MPEEELERAAAYVSQRAGTSFGWSRGPDLLQRLAHAMQRAGCTTAADYRALLDRSPEAFSDLAEHLAVPESYFFRHPAQLTYLRDEIFPDLVRRRGAGATLRFWSAGCSTGQEAYTLAILLEEEGLAARSHVLGTDVSPTALAVAEAGVYPEWSLRAVTGHQRRAYFDREAGRWRVAERFAPMVTFRAVNLLDDAPEGGGQFDVVVCRNVLIYFTPDAVERAAARLAGSLAPGGWLLTAPADPSLADVTELERMVGAGGVVYRRPIADEQEGARPAGVAGTSVAGTNGATGATGRAGAAGTARTAGMARSGGAAGSACGPPGRTLSAVGTGPADTVPAADGGAEADVESLRALGDTGQWEQALAAAASAVSRFPLDPHLRYLHAVALLEGGRPAEAAAAADAAVYLRPDLAVAHLARARAALGVGDRRGAGRSFRNALALLRALPPDEAVELADGEPAGRLAAMAEAHERLAADEGRPAGAGRGRR